ncbi:hypothetical protein KJ359_011567 [Pestalotiopsis sp. 9143b]|nr:hypothetical protein KJ359_011567 [Pestalotiopsis sp. 9143b]
MPSCVRRMLGYVVTVWLLLILYTGEARSTAVATGREVPNGRTAEEAAPALDNTRTIFDFFQGDSVPSAFALSGEVSAGADEAARLVIRHGGDVPSLVLAGHFRYGRAEVFVKGTGAAGAVTALRLRSGSADEIALELLGGEEFLVASCAYRSGSHDIDSSNLSNTEIVVTDGDYHNLTIEWTSESVQWFADGNLVGILVYSNGTYRPALSQLAITASIPDAQSTKHEASDKSRASYVAEVMNMTITSFSENSGNAAQNMIGNASVAPELLQKLLVADSKTERLFGKRSDLRPRDIHLSNKTKLAFGLTAGIGGGALVFLVIFALFRVNGYCRFRRKRGALTIYSGDMNSQRTSRTTQATLVNSPQVRGDHRNTYYGPRSDQRRTHEDMARNQIYDRNGIPTDRRHTHENVARIVMIPPRDRRHTRDSAQEDKRHTYNRSPQERRYTLDRNTRRHPHDRSHPYQRHTQDDRDLENRRHTYDNRNPGHKRHTQARAIPEHRHTRDDHQIDRRDHQAERRNPKEDHRGTSKNQNSATAANVPGGAKHQPSETPEASKPKPDTQTAAAPPAERKLGLSFLLPGRKKSPSPRPPSARVPSIAELDGEGVSEPVASMIKRRRSLEKKPLPTAPQLVESDLAADDGQGGEKVRYNLQGL